MKCNKCDTKKPMGNCQFRGEGGVLKIGKLCTTCGNGVILKIGEDKEQ